MNTKCSRINGEILLLDIKNSFLPQDVKYLKLWILPPVTWSIPSWAPFGTLCDLVIWSRGGLGISKGGKICNKGVLECICSDLRNVIPLLSCTLYGKGETMQWNRGKATWCLLVGLLLGLLCPKVYLFLIVQLRGKVTDIFCSKAWQLVTIDYL